MKKCISKLVAVMMAVMLLASMLVCVSAAEEKASDFAASDNAGVFGLRVSKGNSFYVVTASLVHSKGYEYLLTSFAIVPYVNDGYELTIMCTDGTNIPATCIAVDSEYEIAYLAADGMEFYNPLSFSNEPFTTTVVSGQVFCNDEYTEAKRVEYKASDLSDWTRITTNMYAKDKTEVPNNWIGSPLFHDTKEYKMQGIGTWYEKGGEEEIQAIMSFEGLELNPVFYVGADPVFVEETDSEPAETTAPTEPVTPAESEPGLDSKYLIIGAVAVAALAYYFYKKKNDTEPEEAQEQEITIDDNMHTQPVVPSHGVTKAVSNWQLRATGGPLNGKTFPLAGTVKIGRASGCDIRFPDGTAGISGNHCELVVSGNSVILRDVGSSYGTFVSGSRLVPHTDKTLYPSDSFSLAQEVISFRLESTGAVGGQTGGPGVKDVNGKTYQSKSSGKLTFGRNPGNSVQIQSEDKQISGNHCVLYREGGKLYLKDLGSTNGTFFSATERLKPNTAYRVHRGQAFFLSSPKHTFVVTEE